MKIHALIALTGASLTAGCVIAPAPYPYYDDEVIVAPAAAPAVIYEPSVVIVERGIVHDRAFYYRHPEIYHRDRLRYPERFHHVPPPKPVHVSPRPSWGHPGPVIVKPAPRPNYGRPAPGPQGPAYGKPDSDRHDKKHDRHDKNRKKKHDPSDNDRY